VQLDFETVDVFTDRRFGGNPLAVITDARGLSTDQMQAIAAEFNLAETTFVLPPESPAHTARVRIFTPRAELPFAGHPNVGTAFVLARRDRVFGRAVTGDRLIFEETAGLVPMELQRRDGVVVGARLRAPAALSLGGDVSPELVAAACGLGLEWIARSAHAPCIASCGTPFIFAELESRDALRAATPRADVFARDIPREHATGIHLWVRGEEAGAEIQTRMFAPMHGIAEDPATGSANVALAGLLAQAEPARDLRLELRLGQGVDMGRPSLMLARADKTAGHVTATYIGGACVPVLRGAIDLD